MINIGEQLPAAGIVTGVAEAAALDEGAHAMIIFGGADPDRVAPRLRGPAPHLVHDQPAVAAAAVIGMHGHAGPDQVPVVALRHLQFEHADRLIGSVGDVEVVLRRLQIPAVAHLPGQDRCHRGEGVRVVDEPRRLDEVGDLADLARVIGGHAYERHPSRVPEVRAASATDLPGAIVAAFAALPQS